MQDKAAADLFRVADIGSRARAIVAATVRAGPLAYDRQRDLPRLVPTLGWQMAADGPRARIVRELARRLRAERLRGRAGHWTYDLNRHIALWQAYAAERGRRPGP